MADNCILEPWTSVLSGMGGGGHWDMDSRESEVMTRALQASLFQPESNNLVGSNSSQHLQVDHVSNYIPSPSSMDQYYSSPSSQILPSPTTPSSAPFLLNPDLVVLDVPPPAAAVTASDSDSPTAAKRPGPVSGVTAGRVSKRRPRRASKKSPTTFIAAAPANFRQMVQEVTGVQIPVMTSGGAFSLSPASFLSRPEPLRAGSSAASWQNGQLGGLPTLDSSAFVLDGSAFFDRSSGMASSSLSASATPAASAPFSSGGLDMGLPCFPTLESSREVK